MRSPGILPIVCILIFASVAYAQPATPDELRQYDSILKAEEIKLKNPPRPTDMIIVNPFKFWRFINISYVHSLSPFVAIGMGPQYATDNFKSVYGYGLTLEARIHPGGKTFYIAPGIAFNKLSYDRYQGCSSSYSTISAVVPTVSITAGVQLFFGNVAFGVGAGFDHYLSEEFSNYTGTIPMARLDLGYGW